jgi:hypothetical protein
MPSGSQVTLGYNSARINEATGNFQAAATEYKGILEAFPGKLLLCSNPKLWNAMFCTWILFPPRSHEQSLSVACFWHVVPWEQSYCEGIQPFPMTPMPFILIKKTINLCGDF